MSIPESIDKNKKLYSNILEPLGWPLQTRTPLTLTWGTDSLDEAGDEGGEEHDDWEDACGTAVGKCLKGSVYR